MSERFVLRLDSIFGPFNDFVNCDHKRLLSHIGTHLHYKEIKKKTEDYRIELKGLISNRFNIDEHDFYVITKKKPWTGLFLIFDNLDDRNKLIGHLCEFDQVKSQELVKKWLCYEMDCNPNEQYIVNQCLKSFYEKIGPCFQLYNDQYNISNLKDKGVKTNDREIAIVNLRIIRKNIDNESISILFGSKKGKHTSIGGFVEYIRGSSPADEAIREGEEELCIDNIHEDLKHEIWVNITHQINQYNCSVEHDKHNNTCILTFYIVLIHENLDDFIEEVNLQLSDETELQELFWKDLEMVDSELIIPEIKNKNLIIDWEHCWNVAMQNEVLN